MRALTYSQLLMCLAVVLISCIVLCSSEPHLFGHKPAHHAPQKQYFVYNNRSLTWGAALRACASLGLRMATITSQQDDTLLQAAVTASGKAGPWWVAGTDDNSPFNFVWMSTNTLVPAVGSGGFTKWSQSPDHQPDNNGNTEKCMEIGRWGGTDWNDAPCTWKQRFICELVQEKHAG